MVSFALVRHSCFQVDFGSEYIKSEVFIYLFTDEIKDGAVKEVDLKKTIQFKVVKD